MIATINAALQGLRTRFLTLEKLTMTYAFVTGLLVLAMWFRLDDPLRQIFARIIIVGIIIALSFSAVLIRNKKIIDFVRVCFQLSLLSYWYSETYEFNKLFSNLDYIFASLEQTIFGFQPALVFAQKVSSFWVSEAFYMGYFSYFPIIVAVTFYCFFCRPKEFNRFSILLLGSFFIYYLIFIFLPVTGPQFYFKAIGLEDVRSGFFPQLGNYFRYHSELLPDVQNANGIFHQFVEMSQAAGERPTAAFPSSHVGMSTILLLWLFKNNVKFAIGILPLYILLCGATVYIQAHYLIDVFAGWITGLCLFFGFNSIFSKVGK